MDGVFQPAANIGDAADAADAGVDFHAATELDATSIAQVQTQVRQRILRAFVRRGLIDKCDGDEMILKAAVEPSVGRVLTRQVGLEARPTRATQMVNVIKRINSHLFISL